MHYKPQIDSKYVDRNGPQFNCDIAIGVMKIRPILIESFKFGTKSRQSEYMD